MLIKTGRVKTLNFKALNWLQLFRENLYPIPKKNKIVAMLRGEIRTPCPTNKIVARLLVATVG